MSAGFSVTVRQRTHPARTNPSNLSSLKREGERELAGWAPLVAGDQRNGSLAMREPGASLVAAGLLGCQWTVLRAGGTVPKVHTLNNRESHM